MATIGSYAIKRDLIIKSDSDNSYWLRNKNGDWDSEISIFLVINVVSGSDRRFDAIIDGDTAKFTIDKDDTSSLLRSKPVDYSIFYNDGSIDKWFFGGVKIG